LNASSSEGRRIYLFAANSRMHDEVLSSNRSIEEKFRLEICKYHVPLYSHNPLPVTQGYISAQGGVFLFDNIWLYCLSIKALFLAGKYRAIYGQQKRGIFMINNGLPTTAQEFLQTLFPGFNSNQQLIEIRPLHTGGGPRSRKFCATIEDAVLHAIKMDKDNALNVYFQCATLRPEAKLDNKASKEYCHSYNFLYADLDPQIKCPRTKVVTQVFTKEELMRKLQDFPLPASIIVDSGNGYHAYWLLDKALLDQTLLGKILKRFQSLLQCDDKATLVTQILRVVGTANKKPLKNGKPAVDVKVVGGHGQRYSLDEVLKSVGNIESLQAEPAEQNIGENRVSEGKSINLFVTRPKQDLYKKPENFWELRDILKKQNPLVASNMPELELGRTFRCLFHDDNAPSANIFQHEDGYFYYKCFGCDTFTDVIGLYQNIFKTDFATTIQELCNFYGIEHVRSKWFLEQIEKYQRNAVFIKEFEQQRYDVLYPNAYKLLWPRLKQLALLNQYALEKMSMDEKYQLDGESLFFISYDYYANKFGLSKNSARNYINLYAVLGLISKRHIGDVDIELQKKSMEQSLKLKEQHNLSHVQPVNYYILSDFFERIQLAETRAKVLLAFSFKIRTCMNKSFLILALGQGIANEVYPDARKVTEKSNAIANSFNKTLLKLIEGQGYATRAQVVNKTKISGSLAVSSRRKEREWDRHKNIILTKNGFTEKWANNALKKELKLRNYCPVIIPQTTAQRIGLEQKASGMHP